MGRSRGPERGEARRSKSAADAALALPAPFAPLSDNPVLIADEQRDLVACEAAIETLKIAFWAAGKALNVIRDARLYRARFETFEDYCLSRWGMQRRYANRLIQAWPVAEALSTVDPDAVNEAQVRELVPLAGRHGNDAAVLVYRAVADEPNVTVTAEVLRGTVAAVVDSFTPTTAADQVRAYLATLGTETHEEPAEEPPTVERAVARAIGTMPHRWLRTIAKQDRHVATAYLDELQRQIEQYRQDLNPTT